MKEEIALGAACVVIVVLMVISVLREVGQIAVVWKWLFG